MRALARLIELGPYKDREELWPEWELNPRPSSLFTAAPPTELQGQAGAGRGNWRCQVHANEYVQVQGRVTFLQTLAVYHLYLNKFIERQGQTYQEFSV